MNRLPLIFEDTKSTWGIQEKLASRLESNSQSFVAECSRVDEAADSSSNFTYLGDFFWKFFEQKLHFYKHRQCRFGKNAEAIEIEVRFCLRRRLDVQPRLKVFTKIFLHFFSPFLSLFSPFFICRPPFLPLMVSLLPFLYEVRFPQPYIQRCG